MTSCGLNGKPLEAKGTYPAPICCNLTNGKMPHLSNVSKNKYAPNINHEGDKRFIKDIENNTLIGYKYFAFEGKTKLTVTYRGGKGKLSIFAEDKKPLACIELKKAVDWAVSDTVEFELSGKQPLYFKYSGKAKIDLFDFTLE